MTQPLGPPPASHAPEPPPWHAASPGDVLARLDTTPEGLRVAGAARRLERYGRNALPAREPPGVWRVMMRQILNPLIWQGPHLALDVGLGGAANRPRIAHPGAHGPGHRLRCPTLLPGGPMTTPRDPDRIQRRPADQPPSFAGTDSDRGATPSPGAVVPSRPFPGSAL
ncbi:cation-transporting P-type ATPase [Deinococcus aestuarii]|uniref:cation-transporting P-type ATPase n=1 Tax=Deinococcus aestuarii TaxID=2774531 RepID=UPI001C0D4DED|nr:cation-transporting P-type ATPase [Deinococcus aestuarii]